MSEEMKNTNFLQPTTETDQKAEKSSSEKDKHHRHHHHHHNHRSSGHRHHSSSSGKNKKVKRFFRKYKKRLMNVAVCLVIVTLLLLLALQQDWKSQGNEQISSSVEITQSTIKIESTLYTKPVAIAPEAFSVYIGSDNTKSAHDVYGEFNGYNTRLDVAVPVTYSYAITGLPTGITGKDGILEISEYQDYSQAKQVAVNGQSQKVEWYHLKAGTKYYYRLQLTLSNGAVVCTNGEFTTQKSPRIITVQGIRNVRDFGGWKTANGKPLKQGLLYRGTELDGAVETTYRLTAEGLNTMIKDLGIRFDLDLRDPSVNKNKVNALGDNLPHRYYSIPCYNEIFQSQHNETVRRIFADMANKDNYPMYIHCTHGLDRTGTICYLLDGLLGVSKEEAYKEYELSAFTDSYVATEKFQSFQQKVDSFAGTTFQQKVENYLLSVGVTPAEINSIREIFLGE